ncbi:hypothetical protein QA648_11000 [Rhizobium sp. CB3171]|uniref:hypothetical protein n=1 Tax=Rhizobium sp. CB3171 TaxID=3039157 RepID=UPI0024B07BDD|nr:hypothetical protein [Rhizobium sp. CB3171]WFU00698.1 hypothetical protein QA648_11000 [Rhizobium sp. CB3171]
MDDLRTPHSTRSVTPDPLGRGAYLPKKRPERTAQERLLGIARISQKMGDVTTARAALDQLASLPTQKNLTEEILRVCDLVRVDFDKEKVLGQGSLLNLDHAAVKIEIKRGKIPAAILEAATRHRHRGVSDI